mmetsp:Transcript_36225/g.87171  ORF Transcript_36225/g.87171 Transcript_36225/m.87171 type:complete len:208 (+) Transcript_36225:80-703(+)
MASTFFCWSGVKVGFSFSSSAKRIFFFKFLIFFFSSTSPPSSSAAGAGADAFAGLAGAGAAPDSPASSFASSSLNSTSWANLAFWASSNVAASRAFSSSICRNFLFSARILDSAVAASGSGAAFGAAAGAFAAGFAAGLAAGFGAGSAAGALGFFFFPPALAGSGAMPGIDRAYPPLGWKGLLPPVTSPARSALIWAASPPVDPGAR